MRTSARIRFLTHEAVNHFWTFRVKGGKSVQRTRTTIRRTLVLKSRKRWSRIDLCRDESKQLALLWKYRNTGILHWSSFTRQPKELTASQAVSERQFEGSRKPIKRIRSPWKPTELKRMLEGCCHVCLHFQHRLVVGFVKLDFTWFQLSPPAW